MSWPVFAFKATSSALTVSSWEWKEAACCDSWKEAACCDSWEWKEAACCVSWADRELTCWDSCSTTTSSGPPSSALLPRLTVDDVVSTIRAAIAQTASRTRTPHGAMARSWLLQQTRIQRPSLSAAGVQPTDLQQFLILTELQTGPSTERFYDLKRPFKHERKRLWLRRKSPNDESKTVVWVLRKINFWDHASTPKWCWLCLVTTQWHIFDLWYKAVWLSLPLKTKAMHSSTQGLKGERGGGRYTHTSPLKRARARAHTHTFTGKHALSANMFFSLSVSMSMSVCLSVCRYIYIYIYIDR